MSSDVMNAYADMILTDAIEDLANEDHISLPEARNRILNSKAYSCLYDFKIDLWQEGPDYFLDFFRGLEQKEPLL